VDPTTGGFGELSGLFRKVCCFLAIPHMTSANNVATSLFPSPLILGISEFAGDDSDNKHSSELSPKSVHGVQSQVCTPWRKVVQVLFVSVGGFVDDETMCPKMLGIPRKIGNTHPTSRNWDSR
jgi:hypothetical protein